MKSLFGVILCFFPLDHASEMKDSATGFQRKEDNYIQQQSWKTSRLKERVTELKAEPHYCGTTWRGSGGEAVGDASPIE